MKQVLFLCVLIPGICNCQKINGIGTLLINKTTIKNCIDSFEKLGYKYLIDDDDSKFFQVSNEQLVLELKQPDPTKVVIKSTYESPAIIPIEAPFSKNMRVLRITNFEISDVFFNHVTLEFYKDTLITISGVNDDQFDPNLLKALQAKYKVIDTKEKKNPITCVNGLGIKTQYEEWQYELTFRKDIIEAEYSAHKYYNDKCKEQAFELLYIGDVKKEKISRNEESAIKKAQDKKEKQTDKEKYKDF